jgi:4-amino-4-deoxy-L-arabinose transferase-like glycosyltransferase
MSRGRWLAAAWPRLALAAVVLAAAGQALLWVFLVPIYQAPDEPEHLDYALAIHAHRGLFLAQGTAFKQLPGAVHPCTAYLARKTWTGEVAFHPSARMPPGYGTRAFYKALDREAPPLDSVRVERPSQLAALYPPGYYTLLAGWIGLVRLGKDSVVTVFFGARVLSVVLLSASLVLTYGTARLLHFPRWFSLLLTAGIGTFPLTSFVSSYIQPDNLAFTLVSLCFYLALRARRQRCGGPYLALLGLALGALLITKVHFWLCVAAPVLAMVVAEVGARPQRRRGWAGALLPLALPSLLLGAGYWWTVRGTPNYFAQPGPGTPLLDRLPRALLEFYGGKAHASFWGVFGWADTPLRIGGRGTTTAVRFLTRGLAWAGLGLTLLWLARVTARLVRVARRGRPRTALRAALSNPVVNSYLLFTALMLCLYLRRGPFGAQGRHWLPFLLPIFLVGLVHAPRALRLRPTRLAFSGLAAGALLLYGVVGNYCARATVRERYYLPFAAGQLREVPLPVVPVGGG